MGSASPLPTPFTGWLSEAVDDVMCLTWLQQVASFVLADDDCLQCPCKRPKMQAVVDLLCWTALVDECRETAPNPTADVLLLRAGNFHRCLVAALADPEFLPEGGWAAAV